MTDRTSVAIVSFLIIVGYLVFGLLLLVGVVKPNVSGDLARLVDGVFDFWTAAFFASCFYWLGSSAGKDALIAGQLPQATAPPTPPEPISPISAPPQKPLPSPPTPEPSPAPSVAPPKMTDITATIFSESEPDNAQVAYPDVPRGWSNRYSLAVPFHFHGTRPKVRVWGPKGSAVCDIVDVGPWYDGRAGWPIDPYWQTGARPRAESDSRTNGAGIDLSPATALAVGISDKGKVDWAFVDASAPAAPATPPTPSAVEPTTANGLAKHVWPLQSEILTGSAAFYGDPNSADWEKANLVEVQCPWPLQIDSKTTHAISIHSKCADSLREVLEAIWEACGSDLSKISTLKYDRYDGSYNNRPMRGGTTLSMHAYGCALDFDAADNPFHSETHLFTADSLIVQKFEAAGWVWGGRWMSPDAMHFQAARVHP